MIVVTQTRGTEEWRREHRCRVSASDVDAALARRGTKKYGELVDRLARNFDGFGDETEEYPDPWHERHEEELRAALAAYRLETAEEVRQVGLVLHDELTWLAASPHGLVGDRGAVLFRIRHSLKVFHRERLALRPRDEARAQVTMFVCDLAWVDVVDYWDGRGEVPDRISPRRVDRDHAWFSAKVLPRLVTLWGDVSTTRRDRRGL